MQVFGYNIYNMFTYIINKAFTKAIPKSSKK